MKKLFLFFFAISVLLFSGCGYSFENAVICVQLDPLEKVFTEESYFVENPETAAIVKGETATFQFVVRSSFAIQDLKVEAGNLKNGDQQVPASLKAFVDYIRAGNHAGDRRKTYGLVHRSKDAIVPPSDYYPDCLREVETVDVPPMRNQPVWVAYKIPRDAAAGDYTATLVFTGKINGKPIRITKEVNAKVYPVVLPEQTLSVVNWLGPSSLMNGDQRLETYSDRYWELYAALANVARDHGQNVYLISGPAVQVDGTQYTLDFTNFDKTVELLIREGGLKRIAGPHFAGRPRGDDGWEDDFEVFVPKMGARPLGDPVAQNYLTQYFTAMYDHLKAKGWASMYMQHVADEPIDENAASYANIAAFVKKLMPGIPIVDAIMTHKLANTVNIWVPILDQFHLEYPFYQERQAAGDEIWFYLCTATQDNYANRYLETPLVQTRFLQWIHFRYGSTGYLHYGFNAWGSKTNDGTYFGQTWPAGDPWIVYPKNGGVYTSIRLAAERDGIADYELLKLLEKKAPDKAKEIASAIIKEFDMYNSNVRAFRLYRLELLKALCE